MVHAGHDAHLRAAIGLQARAVGAEFGREGFDVRLAVGEQVERAHAAAREVGHGAMGEALRCREAEALRQALQPADRVASKVEHARALQRRQVGFAAQQVSPGARAQELAEVEAR